MSERHTANICVTLKWRQNILNLALQEDDPGIVLMALRNIAEAQEGGIAGLAARSRLGRESMYKMLSERGNPKLSSFTRIIHSLGLCLKVQTHV